MRKKLKYWVALNHFPKFGPVRFKKLKKYFSDLENAFKASSAELIKAGIEQKIADEFVAYRVNINPDQLMEELDKENIKILTIEDKNYPKLLAEIYDPPQFFYYKGNFDIQDEFPLAVVGSRKFTNYGKQTTEKIVKDLAKNNLTIVSGLALGVDSTAHSATLEVQGRTIAVLGSGLDRRHIYPSSNYYLSEKIIAENGVVLSEFPIGTPPLKQNFPQRNRIVSGLSLGVLVIEAAERSGALITARHALDQNREVFAVPGNIYSPVSAGSNKLIKLGARATTEANDIIEALDLNQITTYIDNKKIVPESVEEEEILKYLTHEPIHVNEIIRLTGLTTNSVSSALTIMEMKGMVCNAGGMQYVLAR